MPNLTLSFGTSILESKQQLPKIWHLLFHTFVTTISNDAINLCLSILVNMYVPNSLMTYLCIDHNLDSFHGPVLREDMVQLLFGRVNTETKHTQAPARLRVFLPTRLIKIIIRIATMPTRFITLFSTSNTKILTTH